MPSSIFNGDAVKILKDKLRFKTTGEIGWDAVNGCPSYPSDIAGITNQIGQETHVRVYNATGAIIENGSVVYVDGGVDGDGLHPSVAKAIATSFATSRVLGIVTADIAIGAHGIVTKDGLVNGLDTSAFAPGTVLKLSASVAGAYSSTSIIDGNFDTTVGIVVNQHASNGSILVYNNTAAYTAETVQKTGWSNVYGPATIAFVDANRTLTLSPVGTEFHYYQAGVKYSKTTDSYQIADTEGLHYLYYNGGVITDVINPTNAQVANILQNYTTIAYIGWDATNKLNIFVGKELHDMQFPSLVHNYNHFAYGARYLNGLGPNSIIAEGNGSLDSHAQFGLDAGTIADEDIFLPTTSVTSTAGLPIYYLAGTSASPTLRKTTQAGFAVKTTGTGRLAYNFLNAGNWTLAEVSNSDFVLCHVFCIHENDITKRPIAFMGQEQYSSVALARAGAQSEIATLVLTGIIPQEIKSIATFVFQTQDSYTNSVNARIREISTGVNFIDWRAINNTGGSSASSNPTTSVFADNLFQIYDDLDATKTAQFQASGITTGTNRVLTIPDATTTIVGTDVIQTLSNKTFDDSITNKQIASPALPSAGYNRIYPKADGLYYYQTPTAEFPVDLKGDYNFIATKLATDWIGYDDGAAAFPVDGTDGTATGCTLVAATSPISTEPGIINLKLTKDAADRQGKGFGLAFNTRGDIDKAAIRVCKINVASTANYVDGDVICMLYDTVNLRLIYPADQRIFASSLVSAQQFEFQLSADSTAYRLILHVASTNASAYELNMVAKFVETKKQTGPIVSDWKPCTITTGLTGGTGVAVTAWEKQIGDTAHYKGRISWTTSYTGGSATLTIPRTIDSTKMQSTTALFSNILGTANFNDAGTDIYPARITYNSSNSVVIRVYGDDGGTSSLFVKTTVIDTTQPVTVANADSIEFEFSVPIVGWSSNQVLSEDISLVRNIVEGNGNNSSALTSDVTDVNFTEVIDTAGCWDGSGFTADSTCTIMFSGLIRLTAASSASIVGYINGTTTSKLFGGFASTGGYFNGTINLTYGQRFSLRINENRTLSNVPSHVINIVKIANPQQIAASEKCYGYYTSSNGASLTTGTPATFVPLTKVVDSHNALSSGILTSPMSGVLTITASTYLACSGTSWVGTQGEYFELDLLVGASNKASTFNIPVSTTRDTDTLTITAIIPVVKGDLVKINVLQTSGVSGFTVGTTTNSWMSWTIQ